MKENIVANYLSSFLASRSIPLEKFLEDIGFPNQEMLAEYLQTIRGRTYILDFLSCVYEGDPEEIGTVLCEFGDEEIQKFMSNYVKYFQPYIVIEDRKGYISFHQGSFVSEEGNKIDRITFVTKEDLADPIFIDRFMRQSPRNAEESTKIEGLLYIVVSTPEPEFRTIYTPHFLRGMSVEFDEESFVLCYKDPETGELVTNAELELDYCDNILCLPDFDFDFRQDNWEEIRFRRRNGLEPIPASETQSEA